MTKAVRIAASQSFSEEEIEALDQLLKLILRGGDTYATVRSEAMISVMRKVLVMKTAIARQKRKARGAR